MTLALKDVELDVATWLAGLPALVPGLTLQLGGAGQNLWAGPMGDAAGNPRSVSVRFTGGDTEDFLGGGGTVAAELQVLVRGEVRQYTRALELARALWQAMHLPASPPPGYVQLLCEGAGPSSLGPDAQQRERFVFTAIATYTA